MEYYFPRMGYMENYVENVENQNICVKNYVKKEETNQITIYSHTNYVLNKLSGKH